MATQTNNSTLGNGVNLQPSYYNNGNVNFGWGLMQQQANITTVRIEIEPGRETHAAGWIADAQRNGYQVIATYHKHTANGSNDVNELLAAANWWVKNYQNLGGNFIINLMNEWGSHKMNSLDYALAYNQAIAIVRTVYNGPIVIDLPGWGQEVNRAYAAVTLTDPVITDTNIVLSVHIYLSSSNTGGGGTLVPADLDLLNSCGRPCIVGEFGAEGEGLCDWSVCVDHAKSLGWPVIGWCWNGDGEDFNMVSPSWKPGSFPSSFTLSPYFDTIYSKLSGPIA